MTDHSMPTFDRRALLTGRWPARARAPAIAEVASVLVQARPERLAAVTSAIEALDGCEVFQRSPQGKLVVVIEADDVGIIGTTLNRISSLPHVLTAALVFHGTDQG
jgi:periplasmic nitrate reductase NapD